MSELRLSAAIAVGARSTRFRRVGGVVVPRSTQEEDAWIIAAGRCRRRGAQRFQFCWRGRIVWQPHLNLLQLSCGTFIGLE